MYQYRNKLKQNYEILMVLITFGNAIVILIGDISQTGRSALQRHSVREFCAGVVEILNVICKIIKCLVSKTNLLVTDTDHGTQKPQNTSASD